MNLYTAQLSKYSGPDLIDITVKSGLPMFSPTWDMVMGIKNGTMGIDEYIDKYNKLMNHSMSVNTNKWIEICNREEVTLGCYCRAGEFCHRFLLADIIIKFAKEKGIGAKYCGERRKQK